MSIVAQWIDNWFIPIWILFFIICTGYYLGQIKIKGISLDLTAILIVSIIVGVLFGQFPSISIGEKVIFQTSEWNDLMRFLSPFGSALFISSVGLSTGYEIHITNRRKMFRYFGIGSLVVTLNFFLAKTLSVIDGTLEQPLLFGIFCGSMTSSPGLATICEASPQFASKATSGYGSSYLIGVICVVLFVQFMIGAKTSPITRTTKTESSQSFPVLFGIIQISFAILVGTMLGSFHFPKTNFSLGVSGGILISSIIMGYVINRLRPEKSISEEFCNLYRCLGLVLFFVGNGVPAGMQLRNTFIPHTALYAIIFTIFPIVCTYCICRVFLKNDKWSALNAVCGTMTSTPAFGILSRKNRTSANNAIYTSTYTGALITIVILLGFST